MTLARTLAHHCHRRPNHRAVTTPTGTRTYAQLTADVARIASTLRDGHVARGSRIAVLARNGLPCVQLVYAASWSGTQLVCVNWRLGPEESRAVLADSAPVLVFAEREFAHLIGPRERVIWLDGPGHGPTPFEQWYADGDPHTPPNPNPDQDPDQDQDQDPNQDPDQDPESAVLLLYTTGTTGSPKGVPLLERNLSHTCVQATRRWRMHPDMTFLACLPMFHVSGMSSVVCSVHVGGELVVPSGTSVAELGTVIEERGVTHTVLVPTILSRLVAENAVAVHDFDSLEVVIYGAAPAGDTLVEQAMEMLPHTGFSQGYGLTETCAGVAIEPLRRYGDAAGHPGSVGEVLDNCACRVVDPRTGEDVAPGADGEIWLRTPQLTPGYLNKPEETAAAITPDGWFRTGDIGCLDDEGFLYLKDRLKDMIISGGENIYSVEVENVVATHPAVLEAAVIGVPDPAWGETVKAFVVLRRGETLDSATLRAWLEGRIARYKRPRIVEFVDQLPRTGSGKVMKRALLSGERMDRTALNS
ncbi:class I adenylate-forming enzyme family protein [Streptomyces endophyticus]|uniref:AMP-binding protein n=1 Tax=Streptomyces endophyticus TaxID=714166 RepID=A0ABU6F9R9_9ACTN|nr:AMP-binding protein [Streptomyces endophyticus]MEB8339537.1 AMP-binding protein [Streptomyces endophyticus]